VVTSGCIVGGECVTEGDHHIAYPCLVCDSSRDATDWSPVEAGESCGGDRCAMGRLFRGGTCDGMGECEAPAVSLCETLECEDPQTCAISCVETGCPASERCTDSGRCVPILGSGATCTDGVECQSGMCIDGVCCGTPCDGTCVSCTLPGHEGECSPIAAGTDPYEECNGRRVCDGAERCVLPGEDAGTDAGVSDASIDASERADASSASLQRADCNCSAAGAGDHHAPLFGLSLVGLALVLVRRARR
jgi:MYXO-CTERM domain-containing protein